MDARQQLLKAYSFHSFNRCYRPNLGQQDGLDTVRTDYPLAGRPRAFRYYSPVILLLLVLLALIVIAVNDKAHSHLLFSPIAVVASASFALYGVLRTLAINKLTTAENNAINALNQLWKGDTKQLTKLKPNTYSFGGAMSFHDAINHYRKLQLLILEKSSQDQHAAHMAVLGSRLALANVRELEFIALTTNRWEKIAEAHSIHRNTIRKGLNEIESLCQGIEEGVYDEKLVRNRIGADISALTTYLLPYIYTVREHHAYRLLQRKEFLGNFVFSERGEHYTNHNESHDLLYEHLEYYCYKWYYSERGKYVTFRAFHTRLQEVYTDIYSGYARTEQQSSERLHIYPFTRFLSHNQEQTLTLLEGLANS